MSTTPPNFAPQLKPELRHIPLTPLQTHELLLALSRPNYSLITIAADFDLTLPQLSLLISNGEFADEFRACTDANTRFIRHAAAIQLHTVIRTLVATLEEVHYQLHSVPINHLNHHSLEARRFMMEVGRRSAVTLQQLTKLNVPTRITESPAAIIKARPAQTAPETPNSAPKSTQTRLSTGSMSMGSAFGLPEDSMFADAPNEYPGDRSNDRPNLDREAPAHATRQALNGSHPDSNDATPQPSFARSTPATQTADTADHSESSNFKFEPNAAATPAAASVNAQENSAPPRPSPRSLRAAALANPATAAPSKRSPHAPNILDPAFQKQLTDALSLADAFLADLPPEAHPPHS